MPFHKIDDGISSAIARPSPDAPVQDFDGSPEPTLALKSPTMMKMGLAIGDEVIHVLINYIYFFI